MEISRKMFNNSDDNKHPYLFPDLNENIFIILFLTVMLGICLLIGFIRHKY